MADYKGALILKRSELSGLLQIKDYIAAMENAFGTYAREKKLGTGLLHLESDQMEYHIKAGSLKTGRTYFGLKVNSSLFSGTLKKGIPKIKGVIILFDGESGYPLAVLDSIEITIKRTGATTAVAAKYLARKDSRVLTVCGCGNQGRIQLESLLEVLPITRVFAFDKDSDAVSGYVREMSEKTGIEILPVENLENAVRQSDVVTTCTPSRKYFLQERFVGPGTFIAAVGADSPEKQEIEEGLMLNNKVVVDILDQSAKVGELHHAIEAGLLGKENVHAEIGDIILGKASARTSDDEIIIYDATGTAIQDTAAAAICFEKALRAGAGRFINLFE
jgi:alanine dehydrogenase